MAVKSSFTRDDLVRILSTYDLGRVTGFKPTARGTIHTNYIVRTSRGKVVFRFYEIRSRRAIRFEIAVIRHLMRRGFPTPALLQDRHGRDLGTCRGRPFAVFAFAEGRHLERPDRKQFGQLIRQAAALHTMTRGFRPIETRNRWNYNRGFCRRRARERAGWWGTKTARKKLRWLEGELSRLALPKSLPMGICHCDFEPSNMLWRHGRFAALLDFDQANYTYFLVDLAHLLHHAAWDHEAFGLDFVKARMALREYAKVRPLGRLEQLHLFDVYKLTILIDCLWYFRRGGADHFYEKRKVEYLNAMGREGLDRKLFG